jgi:hypothetical protein
MSDASENAQALTPVGIRRRCFVGWTWLIVLFLLILGCLVLSRRASTTSDGLASVLAKEVPELDSFSSSGIASAVLTHETERCVQEVKESGSDSSLNEMERVSTVIGKLRLNLDKELIQIYLSRHRSTTVVSSYLELLHEAPDSDVIVWAVHALQCAKECGRTEEVLDAMEHFWRFNANRRECFVLRHFLDHSAARVLSKNLPSAHEPGH